MTTILGEHISVIKPSTPYSCKVYKNELPTPKYPIKTYRSKTIKKHSGKVIAIAVKLYSGGIRSILRGTHADVLEDFSINPKDVVSVGWELDNGNFVWR